MRKHEREVIEVYLLRLRDEIDRHQRTTQQIIASLYRMVKPKENVDDDIIRREIRGKPTKP